MCESFQTWLFHTITKNSLCSSSDPDPIYSFFSHPCNPSTSIPLTTSVHPPLTPSFGPPVSIPYSLSDEPPGRFPGKSPRFPILYRDKVVTRRGWERGSRSRDPDGISWGPVYLEPSGHPSRDYKGRETAPGFTVESILAVSPGRSGKMFVIYFGYHIRQ